MLTRQLARRVPCVAGIDQDAASIELARRQDQDGKIDLIRGDFLTYPFAPASFGMIASVAALHHMDARAAFDRMSQLLEPGGTLTIVGLARSRLPADLPWEAAAAAANLGYRLTRTYWEQPSPVVWPPPLSYAETRALARQAPSGARYRRRLLWRYSLIWVKPAQTGAESAAPSQRTSGPAAARLRVPDADRALVADG
jgi:SAM-dependent methyltransferase